MKKLTLLRVIALSSSLTLSIGCIWEAHTWANPGLMPGSKSFAISSANTVSKSLRRAMPGPNSGLLVTPGKSTSAIPAPQ